MKPKKIAFLDRDGVINSSKYNNGYIGNIKQFKWVNGAIKTIKFLKFRTLFFQGELNGPAHLGTLECPASRTI